MKRYVYTFAIVLAVLLPSFSHASTTLSLSSLGSLTNTFSHIQATISELPVTAPRLIPKNRRTPQRLVVANVFSPVTDYVLKLFWPERDVPQDTSTPTQRPAPTATPTPSPVPQNDSVSAAVAPTPAPPVPSIIREIVKVVRPPSSDVRLSYLEEALNTLRADLTSWQKKTPTTLELPPTNTVGIGSQTFNTDDINADTLTVSGASTLKGTSVTDLTVSGDTTLNGVAYTWPSADGSASQFLRTNGSGTLSWATAGVASNSLDFDEFVNAMTLDANLTIASAGLIGRLRVSPRPSAI